MKIIFLAVLKIIIVTSAIIIIVYMAMAAVKGFD